MSELDQRELCKDFPANCNPDRDCWLDCRYITIVPNCTIGEKCNSDCPRYISCGGEVTE